MTRRIVHLTAAAILLFVAGALPVPARAQAERRDDGRGYDDSRFDTRLTYILLRLGERRLYLMREAAGDDPDGFIESYPVAVGRREWPTPTGQFHVTDKVVDPVFVQIDWTDPSRVLHQVAPGPSNPLGQRWIGFTEAYGWDIGFHGTPRPDLLGQAITHGCVRMKNIDIIRLYARIRVGTPVIVEP